MLACRLAKSIAMVISVLCAFGSIVVAQNRELRLVTDVIRNTPSAEIGGDNVEPAVPGEWPATLFSLFGAEKCTVTLVGPMVALTAAHCTQHNGVHPLKSDGIEKNSMTCLWDVDSKYAPPPQYPPPGWPQAQRVASSFDYALCKLEHAIDGVIYERIAKAAEIQVRISDVVTILGFGCTDLATLRGYGTLRLARVQIRRLPEANGDNYFEVGNYSTSGAHYCNGDSGGAVYVGTGPSITQRVVVGVNSAVIVAEIGGMPKVAGPSYSASLLTTQAKRFIDAWEAKGSGHHICGYSSKHLACRKS